MSERPDPNLGIASRTNGATRRPSSVRIAAVPNRPLAAAPRRSLRVQPKPPTILDKIQPPEDASVRFLPLLAALLTLVFLAPVAGAGFYAGRAMQLAFTLTLIFAIYGSTRRATFVVWVAAIATLSFVAKAVPAVESIRWAVLLTRVVDLLMALGLTVVVGNRALKGERVRMDNVLGTVCTYLLMGITWAVGYSLVALLRPGAVALTGSDLAAGPTLAGHLYYSLSTLTTLGYGGVSPAEGFARMLSVMEAFAGQVFLVVAVARLIGIHIAQEGTGVWQETEEADEEEDDDGEERGQDEE